MIVNEGTLIFKHVKTGKKLSCFDCIFRGTKVQEVTKYARNQALKKQGIKKDNYDQYQLIEVGKFQRIN